MSLEEKELLNIPESGEVPKRRIKSALHAITLAKDYVEQDSLAAKDRARRNALLNGEPPYTERDLRDRGLLDMVNVNFGEARAALDDALSPYIELFASSNQIADIDLGLSDFNQNYEQSRIVGEEFTWMLREWDGFHTTMNLLANFFVWDGIAWTMWPDQNTWQWDAVSLENFKVARDTKVGDENTECAVVMRTMSVSELYRYIRDPQVAREAGWNPEAVKQAIFRASRNRYKWDTYVQHWEEFEREIKENDIYQGDSAYRRCRLVFSFNREFDGTYTQTIASQGVDEFLYERISKFREVNNCFVGYTYGVGTGTIHTLRGLGQKIFSICQGNNRVLSQMLQAAFTSGQVHVQATAEAAENFQYLQIGPYVIIPEAFTPVSLTPPNFASQSIPIYNTMQMLQQNVTGSFQSRSVTPDGAGRSATEVRAQIQQESALGAAAMALFFTPYNKTLREAFRRTVGTIDQRDLGGKLAMEFRARCKRRGVGLDALRSHNVSVKAVEGIGNGSPQMRELAAEKVMQLSGAMDEVGKQLALREAVASIQGIGWSKVDQLVPNLPPRMGYDFDIANQENAIMRIGAAPVLTGEQNHFVHLQAHIPYLEELIQLHESGQLGDEEAVQQMQLAGQHAGEHLVMLAQNTLREGDTRAIRERLNNAMGYVNQLSQQVINSMMMQQEEMSGQPDESQQMSPKEQYELQMQQLKIEETIAKAQREREAHEQKMAQIREQTSLENLKSSVQLADRVSRPVGRPTLVG